MCDTNSAKLWLPFLDSINRTERYCGIEQCKPWTKKEDLPGRSYKTSTNISHPQLYPYFTFVETHPLELGQDKLLRDYHYKDVTYTTSYGSAYTRKCDCLGTTVKTSSPQTLKYNMIFNWAERMRNVPIRKMPEELSEMKSSYKMLLADRTRECGGVTNDLRPYTLCNVSAVARDSQSKASSEEHSIQKVMDPYISTQQYDYVYISPNEAAKYKSKMAEPVELIVHRKTPVYDEKFLRLKFLDRFIRKKIPMVPHSGMTTEVRDNYRLPLSELNHKKYLYLSPITKNINTKVEVMSTPAMYHTDYNHLGHNWPVKSII